MNRIATNPVRKGRSIEARAVELLQERGFTTYRTIRNSVLRNGRYYSAGNDVFGCVDILAKRQGERMRYIQVTATKDKSRKANDLAVVPWDDHLESVEVWRWVPRKNGVPAHFQTYHRSENYDLDSVNRIFPLKP